jgi:hypothetical protein
MTPAIHLSQVLHASKVALIVRAWHLNSGAWTVISCLLDSKHAAPRFSNILACHSFYFGEPGNQSAFWSCIFQPERVVGPQLDSRLCVPGQMDRNVK